MDRRVKQFWMPPRVMQEQGWKTFFTSAPLNDQLDQIERSLAPALGATFDREKGLIVPRPAGGAAAHHAPAAAAAAGGADGDGGDDSGDDATALNIFQKSASVKACIPPDSSMARL